MGTGLYAVPPPRRADEIVLSRGVPKHRRFAGRRLARMVMQDPPSVLPMHHGQRKGAMTLGQLVICFQNEPARQQGIILTQHRQLVAVVSQLLFRMTARKVMDDIDTTDTVDP